MHTVLAQLEGMPWLVAKLLYGSGLRLMEALHLRVKDLVIERSELIVRDAKGGRDRVTVLPTSIVDPLRVHLAKLHLRINSLAMASSGDGSMYFQRHRSARTLTPASPFATTFMKEQFSAPCERQCVGPALLGRRSVAPFAIVATHLLEAGCDIRTVQELMGTRMCAPP
ncbi:MAG TPA: tyrosine-type recombinase/integrase [Steroidobacteraceae bacterium]|nr:tyrosine-type recombinase/integrase [Steroidobacteraceae bacterium]